MADAAQLTQGSIVWIRVPDPQSRNPKLRAFIIISPQSAIVPGAALVGVAVTGTFREPVDDIHIPMRWNLGTQEFRGVVVEFSADGSHWEQGPKDAAAVRFARVIAPDNNLEITFLRAVGDTVISVPTMPAAPDPENNEP